MNMNNFKKMCFVFVFAALMSNNLPAIEKYRNGDTLFVWASSGLSLRQVPSFEGKKLLVLPYGSAIIALEEKYQYDFAKTFFVEEIPPKTGFEGLKIRGNWVKIRHQGETGYVFDGYLSKLKPKIIVPRFDHPTEGWWRDAHEETIFEYALRVLEVCCLDYSDGEYAIFKNGFIYDNRKSPRGAEAESTIGYSWTFPNLTFEEGYLLTTQGPNRKKPEAGKDTPPVEEIYILNKYQDRFIELSISTTLSGCSDNDHCIWTNGVFTYSHSGGC